VLPVLPLRGGTIVYPLAVVPLAVAQPQVIQLIDDTMRRDRLVAMIAQRRDDVETPGPDDLYRIGAVAIIHQLTRGGDGALHVVVQGLERIRMVDIVKTDPYLVARLEPVPERFLAGPESAGLRREAVDRYRRLVGLFGLPEELAATVERVTDPRQLVYLMASTLPFDRNARQELLELDPVDAKLHRLVDLLQRLDQRITPEIKEQLAKQRSIQEERGERKDEGDVADLRRRFEEVHLPEKARREAERELNRLASIPPASREHGLIRTYLDWMFSLPWEQVTGGDIDMVRAKQVLDEDHYDLEKTKDRILEYLAVRKLRRERAAALDADLKTPDEPVLCFVGPPGVGKTSLEQSIARALGRNFVRVSLAGVRDEAEVRGHRRTHVSALPGRIIQGLRRAHARDPVFVLDDIDKVGADWRGDPALALLEVLDGAQNHAFVDHYLDVPFDLSHVLFIATASTIETIPLPLLKRVELIALSGYTAEEKVQIARHYLVPKQVRVHGLTSDEVSFDDESIRAIIRGYTREVGVGSLEREIATVCRKVARNIAEGKPGSVQVTADNVADFLNRPRFFDDVAERTDRSGVATGLAWTPGGGDVLFVEATMMPSQEERLILTGMLGGVMRESALAALSFVRSNAEQLLGLDPSVFLGKAVHIHVPAGAIPKDGPSAGITVATAIASLASGRPVRSDVAMSGEITLRGKVLQVGGIREKVLAAHSAGITTVILPRRNERDLDDVPADLRQKLEFVFADEATEVLDRALKHEATRVDT
jgi:ATP-dependent Lon protease